MGLGVHNIDCKRNRTDRGSSFRPRARCRHEHGKVEIGACNSKRKLRPVAMAIYQRAPKTHGIRIQKSGARVRYAYAGAAARADRHLQTPLDLHSHISARQTWGIQTLLGESRGVVHFSHACKPNASIGARHLAHTGLERGVGVKGVKRVKDSEGREAGREGEARAGSEGGRRGRRE